MSLCLSQELEYVGSAQKIEEPAPECVCFYVEGTGGCKADCSNRKNRLQCDPESCPCGTNCTNVLFAGVVEGRKIKPIHRAVKVGVFNTPKKGWALKALEDVGSGRLVEEVMGEVLPLSDCASRLQTPRRRAACSTTASHFVISLGMCPREHSSSCDTQVSLRAILLMGRSCRRYCMRSCFWHIVLRDCSLLGCKWLLASSPSISRLLEVRVCACPRAFELHCFFCTVHEMFSHCVVSVCFCICVLIVTRKSMLSVARHQSKVHSRPALAYWPRFYEFAALCLHLFDFL